MTNQEFLNLSGSVLDNLYRAQWGLERIVTAAKKEGWFAVEDIYGSALKKISDCADDLIYEIEREAK